VDRSSPVLTGGLLNISLPWQRNALGEIVISSRGEWSKKPPQQGRSLFDARSVLAKGRERRWRLFSTFPQGVFFSGVMPLPDFS